MENINIEFDPVLDFKHYSDAIVKIIQGSEPKFSIGIYGEWGTGKTTLMKLVEKKINDHLFKWDSVPGEDIVSLFHFLNTYLGLSWTKAKEDIEIKKTEDEKILHISSRHNKGDYLSFTLKGSKVILDIGDKDKQRVEYLVKGDKDNPFVHLYQNNILTVWFNAWRYEREEHYALIALMKTIAYAMGEHAIYKDLKPIFLK